MSVISDSEAPCLLPECFLKFWAEGIFSGLICGQLACKLTVHVSWPLSTWMPEFLQCTVFLTFKFCLHTSLWLWISPDQMELAISQKLRVDSLPSRDTEDVLDCHTLAITAEQSSAQLLHHREQVLSPLPRNTNYKNSYLFPHTVAMALKQPDASW